MEYGIKLDSRSSGNRHLGGLIVAAAIAAAALLVPTSAKAQTSPFAKSSELSLGGSSGSEVRDASIPPPAFSGVNEDQGAGRRDFLIYADDTPATAPVQAAAPAPAPAPAAGPAPEQPNIHGFADVTFTTAYLTPRGLLVFDKGVVIQPIVGLVLPIGDLGPLKNYTWVSGVWNCIAASQGDPDVGGWNEMDFFFSQSGTVADIVNLNLTYGEWNFPESTVTGKPKAEQNLDLKISIDDSKLWGDSGVTLNPYVDCWWAMAGSSTVTFGRAGGTGYFEVGVVPTYTIKAIDDYPIKITVPTYLSIGPKNYWGRGGYIAGLSANSASNFGVAYTALNFDVPLSFIPSRYGHWHADAGISYDYLINGALLDAGTLLTGNTKRNLVEGTVGFGVNF